MMRLFSLCLSALSVCAMPQMALAQSAFGCTGLDGQKAYAAVEGDGGMFYRVNPDLRMFNAFSDGTADQVAALSQALATLGTTLVFVHLPSKSLAMPEQLPQAARDYSFDISIATTVYLEAVKKLRARDVQVVDPRLALRDAGAVGPSFFGADYRLTSAGAERLARAISDVLTRTDTFATLPKGRFDTAPAGKIVLDSPMRSALQRHCLFPLPPVETEAYTVTQLQVSAQASDTAIFGAESVGGARVAVVGTEVDGEASANLAGFVAKHTGLQTMQYAVSGGGAFAAISSYLTSPAFQEQRPAFLVWSVPVTENLARHADQPMAELIAAAGDTCRVPLPTMANTQTGAVVADLSGLAPGQTYTLYLDATGTPASEAKFDFTSRSGEGRTKSIYRHKDQVQTGRFYMPMTGLWAEGAQTVSVSMDVPLGANVRITACLQ